MAAGVGWALVESLPIAWRKGCGELLAAHKAFCSRLGQGAGQHPVQACEIGALLAGEELEGGAGEGVLVGAPIDVVAGELFGGGVGDGADGEVHRCAANALSSVMEYSLVVSPQR